MKISLVFALVGTLGGAVWAQAKDVKDAPPTPTLTQLKSQTYSIKIRNVKASLMAYWLDPTNHEVPIELGPAAPKETHNAPPNRSVFQLPTGVTRIIAVDPQNALLVFGTPEGVAQLRSTIAFLDRPLQQVEIEAKFVQLNVSELRAFGLEDLGRGVITDFNNPQPNRIAGFIRGNFDALLTASMASGKAKVITTPRVLAINNLTASLSQSSATPVEIGVRDATGTLRPLEDVNSLEGAPGFLVSELKFEVTPTINNDDTVTLLMNAGATRHLVTNGTATNAATAPASQKDSSLKTIVNVRDGETIALVGALPAQKDTTVVLFVTARIVRRVGDDK